MWIPCYDRLIEEVTSCSDSGKVKNKERKKAKREGKGAQMEEKEAAMEVEVESKSKAKHKLTNKTERYEIENVIREKQLEKKEGK